MTFSIEALPEEVVHRIAAGEVIDSLAAAVRELAENAIDAGATRITIALWMQQWKLRVADNGCGMELRDLQRAATAHSTSKIRSGEDLWRIRSLGFRGEALHSLAQLAELEIGSRSVNSWDGWWVSYDSQGNPLKEEVAAIAPGTVVIVSNLFGNWLPRRQSLPNANQQLRSIQKVIQHLALCHPHITWQVENDDRVWFSLWAGETALTVLPQLVRDVQSGDLREVRVGSRATAADYPPSSPSERALSRRPLYLLLGLPDRCHRQRPDWVKVAVNGRVVQVPELEQTLLSTFRRVLPRDRHPVCFLHLHLAPDQVDWNRHPAKAEIYLRDLQFWQTQIEQAVTQALSLEPNSLPESAYSERIGQLLKTAEAQGAYATPRSIQPQAVVNTEDAEAAVGTEEEVMEEGNPSLPPSNLRAIAQVRNTYIVAEHPGGVWLVEQHIAHERVVYEQLCDRWKLVPLEPPIILSHLTTRQVEQLQRLEIDVELFGEQRWAIRCAPEAIAKRDDCADALLELSLGGDLESALVATACRTAIRNGTSLTLPAMQTLLDQWQQTRSPRTCPHGRPICLSLEESSLSRYFRRHWVIGKSHGI